MGPTASPGERPVAPYRTSAQTRPRSTRSRCSSRSRALLDRLEPHIFHGRQMRPTDLRAGLRSLWRQGIARTSRRDYFGLLFIALKRDLVRFRGRAVPPRR